ncbi:pyridoxamine 5'-phosphate oxidase family protein [Mycolicibacillus parakoreensis]|uniref:Pyridoxamine 5'-phosphate oxidase family protein n=1 Tax=Mycolicibacillus parakoreensis TaxID=1069221 RepID=A0ABY3U0T9_9MYCO|nr:pyridoxamine 5'-phosphate oxidase family protein [Mycolicibacillus parakoreensis]MCV7316101.1 pyridoxamine 5'-phosphate oxidase family protein [Mycolicibacillus parakoreensis]ULN52281.1 pyridoxamine 5'-phosphate oxidase family protein [Mycolicibacillus parakoreensis]
MARPFTETERQQFLADPHICVLSVAAGDGRPPAAIPIWYHYSPGGVITINTGVANRTARLVRAAGVVTVTVQREKLPYQYVVVEGTVIEATTPAPLEAREKIAVRYLGEKAGRQFARSGDDADAVLFTIRPDRWRSVDFTGDL